MNATDYTPPGVARLRAELAETKMKLAAVRGAAKAVLEHRDDDIAFSAAVNVLVTHALGPDAFAAARADGEVSPDALAEVSPSDEDESRFVEMGDEWP